MADLLRSAKSVNSWTLNDLDSYHITLNQVDALLFFGSRVGEALGKPTSQVLPPPLVGQELLTNVDARTMQQYYLELAVMP
ncbi:hypothetical protein IW262DRAFT_1443109 [Armillaria fumosa]|nr:hypothetical protein IW262DRAFT_1443109 [Armillaria fumosa]